MKKGANTVEATVKGSKLTDAVEWTYTEERKVGEAETLNSDKMHWGF